MKAKKSSEHGHVEVSPLTYSPKGFSKSRFIFTVVLTAIVSLSLIVGGTITFFGMGNTSFITVNGRELVTQEIMDSLQSQLAIPGLTEQQKVTTLMQTLGSREQSLTWMFYGQNHGINVTASDIYEALKAEYQEQKEAYQKKYKSYFSEPYADFVKNNVDTFNLSITLKSLNVPNTSDDINVSQEYRLDKTSSILTYRYTSVPLYFLKTDSSSVEKFYSQEKQKVMSGKTLQVISFPSSSAAEALSKQIQKNPSIAKQHFSASNQTLDLLQNRDTDAFLYVQNTPVGSVTPAFTYKGKNYIGRVIADKMFTFQKLSAEEQESVARRYVKSLKKAEIEKIQQKIQEDLKASLSKNYIFNGSTQPIKPSHAMDIRDSHTSEALPFASNMNKELFPYLFGKQGTESPILQNNGIYYQVKVLQLSLPSFPIPSTEYKKIQDSIRQREDNLWLLYHRSEMQKSIKVKVNMNNLKTIL